MPLSTDSWPHYNPNWRGSVTCQEPIGPHTRPFYDFALQYLSLRWEFNLSSFLRRKTRKILRQSLSSPEGSISDPRNARQIPSPAPFCRLTGGGSLLGLISSCSAQPFELQQKGTSKHWILRSIIFFSLIWPREACLAKFALVGFELEWGCIRRVLRAVVRSLQGAGSCLGKSCICSQRSGDCRSTGCWCAPGPCSG